MKPTATKKIPRKDAKGESVKRTAVIRAGMDLFIRLGYRKTSIDDIAAAANVAKRTVYLHFDSKAAVFLAILEQLADEIRDRCRVAIEGGGTPTEQFEKLLLAYFKGESELFARSKHLPELTETITQLAQEKIARLNAEYEALLLKFLRDLTKTQGFAEPPPGLTVAQMVRIVTHAAMAAKHEAMSTGDWESFYRQLRQLSVFGIAALRT